MAIFRRKTKSDEHDEDFFIASQWQLMRWKFYKHKVAVVCLIILALFYLAAIFCEFVAPNDPHKRDSSRIYSPVQKIHFFGKDGFHLRPFVYGFKPNQLDENWTRQYEQDETMVIPIRFFAKGAPYRLWGIIPSDRHLFCGENGQPVYLLGADHFGRDMLSRVIYGSRVSLSVGIIGIFLSLIIGCVVGGISGFFGGHIDTVIQRIIETLMGLPRLPLWMGLSAALPSTWPPLQIYFGMVVILSLLGWTGLARVVRGKIISLREEDFAMAAHLAGASEMRIIRKHLLPSFYSYLIVSLTLAVPNMILAETTLSYLGLGLKPPVISWGVLLQQAQSVKVIASYPWIMLPGLFVIIVVLAFNFLGDGMRDAADPYAR